MKKILILSTLTAATLFATNGDNLIGLGVESRALGGTGIANFNGAENALSNPALLGKTKVKKEFSFGGTIFSATVKAKTTAGNGTNGTTIPGTGTSRTSAQDKSMIPVVALLNRINENIVFGLGMYGTAGMGTDWRKKDTPHASFDQSGNQINTPMNIGLYNMRSALMLMQFAPSLAYNKDNFGIGFSAIMQYGQLSIDYDTRDATNRNGKKHIGNGPSQDYGYGYQIGGFYDINKNLTVAGVYKSTIDMTYKDQISQAAEAFGYGTPGANFKAKTDHLEQPAEIGVGISYNMGHMTYTGDYKIIKWEDAKGYKDFGWENQNVLALGAKYTASQYWYGLGYNSANNPIPDNKDSKKVTPFANNTNGDTMNLFNYAMFPATITKAYTFGAGYNLNKESSISFAYMLAPEVSDTVSGQTVGVGMITTKHSQTATTVAYKFTY